jgi:hypothetical protein
MFPQISGHKSSDLPSNKRVFFSLRLFFLKILFSGGKSTGEILLKKILGNHLTGVLT